MGDQRITGSIQPSPIQQQPETPSAAPRSPAKSAPANLYPTDHMADEPSANVHGKHEGHVAVHGAFEHQPNRRLAVDPRGAHWQDPGVRNNMLAVANDSNLARLFAATVIQPAFAHV